MAPAATQAVTEAAAQWVDLAASEIGKFHWRAFQPTCIPFW